MPRLLLCVLALALVCATPAKAAPGSAPLPFPAFNGVADVAVDGDVAYLGGSMLNRGTPTGPLRVLSAADGSVRQRFPGITVPRDAIEGVPAVEVTALAADGAGGFYVGGDFTRVQGERRVGLVHLRADGSVDPVFRAQALGYVGALLLRGDTLYVGGGFEVIGGKRTDRLAALDARTGEPRDWGPGAIPEGQVDALAIDGDRLYAAGHGFTINGEGRRKVFAVDLATGRLLPWKVHVQERDVKAIAARDGRVYLAGDFAWVNGREIYGLTAVSAADGSLLPFADGGPTDDMILTPTAVVVSGQWGDSGPGLRAYDPATGERLPWFAGVTGDARALALDGNTLYVTGIGPNGLAAFDASTGAPVPFTAGEGGGRVLAAGGGAIATGGVAATSGAVTADTHAVAIDLRTGAQLPWSPKPEGLAWQGMTVQPARVQALAKGGDAVYVGGWFASIGGRAQTNLAAVDPATGAARAGFPNAVGGVEALALSGSTLFVAGYSLTKLGDRPVRGLGAIDLATGTVHDWAPALRCAAPDLEVVGRRLYVAGCELSIFDVTTRERLPVREQSAVAFEPDGAGGVWVASNSSEPYLSHFSAAGAVADYAAVDGPVWALETLGTELVVSGEFETLAGQPRRNLGSIDLTTGRATAFRPEPGYGPGNLVARPDGGLHVFGSFSWMGQRSGGESASFGPGPAMTAPPALRGAAPEIVGDVFTGGRQHVYGGDWSNDPTGFDVRWLRCDATGASCTETGRTGWTLHLSDADTGHRFRARIVVSNDAGAADPVISAAGPVARGSRPFAVHPAYPYVYGVARPGFTVRADAGEWEPAAESFRFLWRRCDWSDCPVVAEGPSYTITAADVDHRIAVTVIARNAAGERSYTVADHDGVGPVVATAPPNPEPGDTPSPVWIEHVGAHSVAGMGDSSKTARVGWLSCDAAGESCIRRASTAKAYRALPEDLGRRLRQTLVMYSAAGESSERISAPSPVIKAGATPTPTPTPSPTPSPTAVPTPPYSPTPGATPTPTATPGATATPAPTTTPGTTATPTPTASPGATATPTPTATPATPAATATASPGSTPTPTPTPTDSPAPSATASPAPTAAPAPAPHGPTANRAPSPRPSASPPAKRVTVALLPDRRVRVRTDATRTVTVRLRDAATRRVLARRTVKLRAGTHTVRVGKVRKRAFAEVTWPGGRAVSAAR